MPSPHQLAIRNASRGFAALLLMLAMSCRDAGPPHPVAGTYVAIQFLVEENGVTTDWLAAGSTVNLVLSSNGTTSGSLLIPDANDDGSDVTESMAGSWSFSRDTLRLQQGADTFMRDMPFAVSLPDLVGDVTFDDVRVRLVLRRTG